jgi:acetate kinase
VTAPRDILTLNVGSATVKAAFYTCDSKGDPIAPAVRAKISVAPEDADDPRTAERWLSRLLADLPAAAAQPARVAHRVVHGGSHPGPAVVSDALMAELTALTPLAPLHQGPALRLIAAARDRWPGVPQVAAFDTSWHASLAPWARRLPLPAALHDAGVMRYGFHGLAFASAMRQLATLAPALALARVVLVHLGGGSSLCAVAEGRSVDTTMGLTPLDGVPMATRSGTLDPGVVLYLARTLEMSLPDIEHLLWRESGLRGLSGGSGDMRELLTDPSDAAAGAREQYAIRVAQAVAAMATSLGGMDAIVFSGGIGDGAAPIRARVAEHLRWTGLRLEATANDAGIAQINAVDSTIAAFVERANEEWELAVAALDRALA